MDSALVVFDDFSGGDYGRDWAGTDTKNKFRAINVIPYPGGWIGPRAPLVQEDPGINFNGAILWFFDNNHILDSDGYAWNYTTGERSDDPVDNIFKLRDYFLDQFGDMAIVSANTAVQPAVVILQSAPTAADTQPTFALSPEGPDGLRADRYQDVSVFSQYRVFRWSGELTWDEWPAENFDAVFANAIYDFINQKNTFVLITGTYPVTSGESSPIWGERGGSAPQCDVYVVYGTLGADATLRKVDTGPAPERTFMGSYIWSASGDTIYWISNRWLVSFNGAEVQTQPAPLPRLLDTASTGIDASTFIRFWSAASGRARGEFVLAGSLTEFGSAANRRAVFNWFHGQDSGAWTAHDPGISYRAELHFSAPGCDYPLRGASDFFLFNDDGNSMVFATEGRGSATAQAPKFYRMSLVNPFPTTEDDGDTGEPVNADFYTADYWEEKGRDIYVDSVLIDYAYDPQSTAEIQAATQCFTVEVEALQMEGDRRPRLSGPITFTPDFTPAGVSSEPGSTVVRGRVRIPVRTRGNQGTGFRIHISDWKGIAIRKITADVRFMPNG